MRDFKIELRHTNRGEDSLGRYLTDLGTQVPLKVEEEVALAKQIKEGDQAALNRLVRANLKFVISVAKTYAHLGVPIGDLINEGNIGLIRAAKTFDDTKGFKFISYAVWYIRAAILSSLGEHLRTIRLPINQVKTAIQVRHKEEQLVQKYEREPTAEEIAAQTDLKAEAVANILLWDQPVTSMDAPVGEEEYSRWGYLPDLDCMLPDQQMESSALKTKIDTLLNFLPKKDREVLKDAFGLDREYPLDFEQLGPKWGKTPTWARQINRRAIKRLQEFAPAELREYI